MKNLLIIFDLDGVLIDSKKMHYDALNIALKKISKKFVISKNDQEKIFEGLPTKAKLEILSSTRNLDKTLHEKIWKDKQEIIFEVLKSLKKDQQLIDFILKIKNNNIKVAVASNSIRKTVIVALEKLGIISLVDFVASNEDVLNPKPHPEIFWNTMSKFNTTPNNTVIFEDSLVGIEAAKISGANLISVINRKDLSYKKINQAISLLNKNQINVLIPMAGGGTRFLNAGFDLPKPLINVNGKTMIENVVKNLNIEANYIYIVQKEHYDKYNLNKLLNSITPDCKIVQIDGITEGAAITCLKAKNIINFNNPLIIANSDQIIEWDSDLFLNDMIEKDADAGILTFNSDDSKWSYVKTNSRGIAEEVAEKLVISENATAGIYYWKHGNDFVKYAEKMISKNKRINNEFYVCPVFNEAINDSKYIYTFNVEKMWGIGTPEDLKVYLNNKK
jgi:HAD superfamily hydrolase (TIGR01509 family)